METEHLVSVGHLAVLLQVAVDKIQAGLTWAGTRPRLTLNGTPYYPTACIPVLKTFLGQPFPVGEPFNPEIPANG